MSVMQLQVCGQPEKAMPFTNAVFVNPSLGGLLHPSNMDSAFAIINDLAVYEIRSHPSIDVGSIAMNTLQRGVLKVSQTDTCKVAPLIVKNDVNLNLAFLQFEISTLGRLRNTIDEDDMIQFVTEKYSHLFWCSGQQFVIDFQGVNLKMTVIGLEVADIGGKHNTSVVTYGTILKGTTAISFETPKGDTLTLQKSKSAGRSTLLRPSFKFSDMGIGGLDEEFGQIFRRAFASRTFPPEMIKKLGLDHVRGMLLHGPPGTGKTLIARQIGKMLGGREPKIVNGPEILNKYVGASEENIRNLFADAEADYAQNAEHADLHIIIFDEIDAICKQRGASGSSTGVGDTVVNQLLSKIDGVNSLNNILVIGMTNRKDMIDEALLRPGRLEVHVEIGLPDEAGRLAIFNIHTQKMRAANVIAPDVDFKVLAAKTKNFSGADITGTIRDATSFSLFGNVDVQSVDKVALRSNDSILITMQHFEDAIAEQKPAFGAAEDVLKSYLVNGIINYGPPFQHFINTCKSFVDQVKNSNQTPLLSVLLKGKIGAGKTAIAAQLAIQSDIPYIKLISPNDFVGMTESEKVSRILKMFRDAYKSPISFIILDNIERLLEYTPIGPRFSNSILQTLLVLVRQNPPNEKRRLLVIGTTSNPEILDDMQLRQAFDVILDVPQLQHSDEVRRVISEMKIVVPEAELGHICATIRFPVGIKKLLLVIEMALQAGDGNLTHTNFVRCLHDCNVATVPEAVGMAFIESMNLLSNGNPSY